MPFGTFITVRNDREADDDELPAASLPWQRQWWLGRERPWRFEAHYCCHMRDIKTPDSTSLLNSEPMHVHFFRHGAAISNEPGLTEAQILEPRFLDAPLNDVGRRQAQQAGAELAKALNGATVDLVLVSPLCRALETAELILESASVSAPVRVIEVLREAHGIRPCDARRSRSVAAAQFASFDFSCVETDTDTWHNAAVRETMAQLRERCRQFECLLRSLSHRTVIVVSHGVFLETLLEGDLGACVTPPTPPGQRYHNCERRLAVLNTSQ